MRTALAQIVAEEPTLRWRVRLLMGDTSRAPDRLPAGMTVRMGGASFDGGGSWLARWNVRLDVGRATRVGSARWQILCGKPERAYHGQLQGGRPSRARSAGRRRSSVTAGPVVVAMRAR